MQLHAHPSPARPSASGGLPPRQPAEPWGDAGVWAPGPGDRISRGAQFIGSPAHCLVVSLDSELDLFFLTSAYEDSVEDAPTAGRSEKGSSPAFRSGQAAPERDPQLCPQVTFTACCSSAISEGTQQKWELLARCRLSRKCDSRWLTYKSSERTLNTTLK